MINRLLSVILIVFVMSCKNDRSQSSLEKPSGPVNEVLMPPFEKVNYFYKTSVTNLRLRPSPTTSGEIITTLSKNHKLVVIETSPFKEKISIGGVERNEPWYKVFYDTDSLEAGWVYGGGIEIDSFGYEDYTQFDELSTIELDGLMQIEGFKSKFDNYQGFYKLSTSNNQPTIDGFWFAKGRQIGMEGDEIFERVYYAGHFEDGKKDGLFVENVESYSGIKRTEISFDSGNCTSNISTDIRTGYIEKNEKPVMKCSF